MWKDDWAVKSQREDMEAALQIERNKEMLEVSFILNLSCAAVGPQLGPQLIVCE